MTQVTNGDNDPGDLDCQLTLSCHIMSMNPHYVG